MSRRVTAIRAVVIAGVAGFMSLGWELLRPGPQGSGLQLVAIYCVAVLLVLATPAAILVLLKEPRFGRLARIGGAAVAGLPALLVAPYVALAASCVMTGICP